MLALRLVTILVAKPWDTLEGRLVVNLARLPEIGLVMRYVPIFQTTISS